MPEHFAAAAALLPRALRASALALPAEERGRCEEVRLRLGRPAALCLPAGERPFAPETPVTPEVLAAVLERAAGGSLHACEAQLRRGFLAAPGGVRVGVCGVAVAEPGGGVKTLRSVSSLCLRVARAVPGAGREILPRLRSGSVLIVSPPGGGKTTLLRALVRAESDRGVRVALIDERFELAGAGADGVPGFDVGRCTDVLSGAPKPVAAAMLLRAMRPEAVAMDEIADEADAAAVTALLGCGVRVFATAHAPDREALARRPALRALLAAGSFDRLVCIRGAGAQRVYEVAAL